MPSRIRFVPAPPLGDCMPCSGSGSEWRKRADGQNDRRYRFPVGPCRHCAGSGNDPATRGWTLHHEPFRHYKQTDPVTGKETWNGANRQRIVSVTDVLDPDGGALLAWAVGRTCVAAESALSDWFPGAAAAISRSVLDFPGLMQLTGEMPDTVRDDKAELGTAAHEYLALRLQGWQPGVAMLQLLSLGQLVPPYGYRAAIDDFIDAHDPVVHEDERGQKIERAVGDYARAVAGTYDFCGSLVGHGDVLPGSHRVDLKSCNTLQPKHLSQVCEYEREAQVCGEPPSDYASVLHITPLGEFRVVSVAVGSPEYKLGLAVFDHYLGLRRGEPGLAKLLRS